MRPRLLLALPLILLPELLLALLVPDLRQFFVGVAVGAGLAMYFWALDSPPEWIERKRRGRDGERSTEKELSPLEEDGWAVAHDVPSPRYGNFDHLVVGPAGAYLLETKNLTGEAALVDGVLTVRRGDEERDTWRMNDAFANRMRGAAREARQLLGPANIHWVHPVVVLWCEFPAQVAEHGALTYVHGSHLREWLRGQPAGVSPQSLESARSCLRRLEADATRAA